MKISEMKTKDAAKMLCSLTGPVSRIAHDKDVNALITSDKQQTMIENYADIFCVLVTAALDSHYDDLIKILSALTGKDTAVFDEQPIMQTLEDAKGIMDDELIRFFQSFVGTAKEK